MQYFKKSSDFLTGHLYPTLSFSIPAYNYLLNMLNNVIANDNTLKEIKDGATEAKKKFQTINHCACNTLNFFTMIDIIKFLAQLNH